MITVKILTILAPFLTWLVAVFLNIWPTMFWVYLVIIALIHFFTSRQISVFDKENSISWFPIFILPFLFTLSLVSFSILMTNKYLIYSLMFLILPILYRYYKNLYYLVFNREEYQKDYLVNFSSYINFLIVYFFSSAIFGLREYINIPEVFYVLILVSVVIFAMIIYQAFWINKIFEPSNYHFILILVFALLQITWVAAFLSVSFYITGMVVAISYYIIIGLTRHYLLGILNARLTRQYLIFGFFSLFVVLFTSRWI